ncbi:xylose isomerase [candidate division KSB1 bacterium]|nr:xylose isomerase [candidate division KSB1 bacterium]
MISMTEYFPEVNQIAYEGPESRNPLAFRFYNPDEIIEGRSMQEWLRFSVCYWHTFRGTGVDPFGAPTLNRPWDDGSDSLENALRRVDVAFEFMSKLGVPFYCFHDRDVAPERKTLKETNAALDAVVARLKEAQTATGIRLLWGTANLFSHPRYLHGAATSCNADVFAYAAAQVKKAMEVTKELGGENYVFWGGREGYMSLLNTDMKRETEHLARFLHMAKDYARAQGFRGTFFIEPKPAEPSKHQYDYDAATVIGFLRQYDLLDDFKLNIEVNHATLAQHTFQHELQVAADAGLLGSIDANRGDYQNGWDTDQFPINVYELAEAWLVILESGGLQGGGVNFDAKTRRNSTALDDLFHAHIGGMDAFARALLAAHGVLDKSDYKKLRSQRYSSFDDGPGRAFEKGELSLQQLADIARKAGEPKQKSGRQELFENIINQYL